MTDWDVGSNETGGGSVVGSLSVTSDLPRPNSASGWINTVPLSASTNTLTKRTGRAKRQPNQGDLFVKDYIKKRNLILDLLVSSKFKISNKKVI